MGLVLIAIALAALFGGKSSGSGTIKVNHTKNDELLNLKPGDKLKIDYNGGIVTNISVDTSGQ